MKKHKHKFKNRKRYLLRAFGVNDYGFADFPIKISGSKLRRLELSESSGCSICFPHGHENYNSTSMKNFSDPNWKRFRPTQWKEQDEQSVYPKYEQITYQSGYTYKTEINSDSRCIEKNGWSKIWKRGKAKWYQKHEKI